jgi:hypothetical protein
VLPESLSNSLQSVAVVHWLSNHKVTLKVCVCVGVANQGGAPNGSSRSSMSWILATSPTVSTPMLFSASEYFHPTPRWSRWGSYQFGDVFVPSGRLLVGWFYESVPRRIRSRFLLRRDWQVSCGEVGEGEAMFQVGANSNTVVEMGMFSVDVLMAYCFREPTYTLWFDRVVCGENYQPYCRRHIHSPARRSPLADQI